MSGTSLFFDYLRSALTRLFRGTEASREDRYRRTREGWLAYLQAKREWLAPVEGVALGIRPELRPTIQEKFRLQLLCGERSAMRLQYFLRHDPSGLDVGAGLKALGKSLHEKWTESDTTSFVREDPKYAQVEEEIRLLRAQPGAPIHEALAEVEKSPEYGKALDEVQRRMREIDAFLGKRAA